MSRIPLWNHNPALLAKVALTVIKKTLNEQAREFVVHPNQIKQWRNQFLERLIETFGEAGVAEAAPVFDEKSLHAKIGELSLEIDCLSGRSARRVRWRDQNDD